MIRRGLRYLFLVLLLLLVLAVAAELARLAIHRVPAAGGSLTVDLHSPSRFVNPLLATTDTDQAISALVFRGLVSRNAEGSIIPDLASRWVVTNAGRDYTFHLRPGVHWQNGWPLTAYDVAFSYGLLKSPSFPLRSRLWDDVEVLTPDPLTVVFRLAQPDFTFLQQLTMGIVPKGYARSSWPIGSGSYRVTAVTPSTIRLSASQPAVRVRELAFVTSSSPSRQSLSCHDVLGDTLASNVGIETTRLAGLVLNTTRLPLAVREALLGAVAGVWGTTYNPAPVWPLSRRDDLRPSSPAPTNLLQRAGWRLRGPIWSFHGRTLRVVLAVPRGGEMAAAFGTIVRAWRRLHIGVTVLDRPFTNLVRTVLYPRSFDAALTDWNFEGQDYNPGSFWASRALLNLSGLRDRRVDKLAAALPLVPDLAARNTIRAQIGRLVVQDGAGIGLSPEEYRCRVPARLHAFRVPRLVTDPSGLVAAVPHAYLNTKLALRNPLPLVRKALPKL
ncbi:MAG TPA: ABC transporter substrate-binding protein [Chloroflexota bacterium]|nr:ABC transporter substrate-binding protein [Chloroflexota bacterium]